MFNLRTKIELLSLTIWDFSSSHIQHYAACWKTEVGNLIENREKGAQALASAQATRLHGHGRGRHREWVEKRAQVACRHDPELVSGRLGELAAR